MKFAGLQKISLIDYPGKICATLFTQGCNFNCPFCHNKELITTSKLPAFSTGEILSFLGSRKGKLQAVCVSGGEPTIQKKLRSFIEEVKSMGFLIKLDTNGYNPSVLSELINANLIDFIAMDIKAPEIKYTAAAGLIVDFRNIQKSVRLIKNSAIPYLFRTTFFEELLSEDDIFTIKTFLKNDNNYITQQYVPQTIKKEV